MKPFAAAVYDRRKTSCTTPAKFAKSPPRLKRISGETTLVSTLRAHELLTHPVRAVILERLKQEPGLAFLALFQELRAHPNAGRGIGFGSLLHHLGMLQRHGRVLP